MKNIQDNEFDNNKLTILDSITVKRIPNSNNELSNEKYVHDSLDGANILRFIQTLENYLKISVGKNVYYLMKYYKIQYTDTTMIRGPKTKSNLLQK